ncbi:MAG: type I DNA topoisomerase [Candidatus Nealsonbacteria bacterium]|nr:type I DNA topoisomerase [Candidatus Nealsonbacteria bacterium]
MQLIIVESPTKGKTIGKFLGPSYKVLSSYGHVRDLPKSKLGIKIKNDFEPEYIIPTKAKKNVQLLKKEIKKSKSVILATDEDREGEAIAWHLVEALELNKKDSYQRIVFHEITKSAIKEALKNPRAIDINLVNAQQARRILDRLVGYKLSPFLWKKMMRGLSAGRVQSVAVRLIADREKEIKNFIPQEYWQITTSFKKDEKNFESILIKKDGKILAKLEIKNSKEAEKILQELKGAEYKIISVEKKENEKNPLPPFTTSTLQQESWQRFKFPAKLTMRLAQNLYEKGFITYHRTDSLNLSELSLFSAKKFINENYGEKYWAGFLRKYKAKGKVQEAHEAIRPAYPDKSPDKLELDENNFKLYDLIWRRFIACQMAKAIFNHTSIEIEAKNPAPNLPTSQDDNEGYIFGTNGQTLKFDGFLKVYPLKIKETELPILEKNEILEFLSILPSQHFTLPSARFTEATLIKELEKNGIGRPSTYAPILATIQERNYVEKNEKRQFQPTEIGVMVNDLLVEHFKEIVDIKFTAQMEEELDEIAEGKKDWVKVLWSFYEPFEINLSKKEKEVIKKDLTEKTEKKCPKCGAPLIIRFGKFGKFLACSSFPKCKHTESLPSLKLGIKCPKCKSGEITEKRTKRKKIFYGCNLFPKCDFALWNKPTGEICKKCGSLLVKTKKEQIKCSNKECDSKEEINPPLSQNNQET